VVSVAPMSLGWLFALVAILVAVLLGFGLLPLTAPLLAGVLILLGLARLVA